MKPLAARPEHVWCVAHERRTRGRYGLEGKPIPEGTPEVAWCGRTKYRHGFRSARHALNHAYAKGYYEICPECADAMTAALAPQTWRGGE